MNPVYTQYSSNNGGHYVPGMEFNGILFISGQLSKEPSTGIIPSGGIKEETKQALLNMELVLQGRGLNRNDVLMCRVYTPDVTYWDEINHVYAEFFKDHKPARAIIPTTRLHDDCLVEIEAIARIKEEQ
ncbi:RidA family protein [Lysinibacillus sp. FSL M8-0355]|uniref:RidA family protein n=1 Tax=Lysinibacillus sp. FSL M8-0355 TaxID=2921719 RepID=UPI0030F92F5F